MFPKFNFESTQAEKRCKNPCKKMSNKVSLRGENKPTGASIWANIVFEFKKTVTVEKKVVAYTLFNFIIDIGSSLGLWLGLSALGIIELIIEACVVIVFESINY